MHFHYRTIDEIEENDLLELIQYKDSESKYIDYKRALPDNSRKGSIEFLSDVSSFANTSGGHIVYGMDEDKGEPIKIISLRLNDPDASILKLEQKIRDGIEPRIHDVEIGKIDLSGSGCSIVIRIARSWNSPHRVTFGGHDKFYARGSRGKYPLDVFDLRTSFILSESVVDRIRHFRTQRLKAISQSATPVPLIQGMKLVVHLASLDAFALAHTTDIKEVVSNRELIAPMGDCNFIYNFDGYLAHSLGYSPDDKDLFISRAYTQYFRNGCIESVKVMSDIREDYPHTIAGNEIDKWILDVIPSYLQLLHKMRIGLPIIIMVSLVDAKGYAIGILHGFSSVILSDSTRSLPYQGITQNILQTPEVMIEDYEDNISTLLGLAFDTIWNAAGWPRSHGRD